LVNPSFVFGRFLTLLTSADMQHQLAPPTLGVAPCRGRRCRSLAAKDLGVID
jgi:hypothetical protein